MGKNTTARVEGGKKLIRKLERMGVNVEMVLEAAAHAGMDAIREGAEGYAPGKLEQETVKKEKGLVRVESGPPKEKWYWRFLEYGAGPHEIVPKKAAALVFEGRRGMVMTKLVHHPGMAARPFMRPGFDEKKKAAKQDTGQVLRTVIEKGGL